MLCRAIVLHAVPVDQRIVRRIFSASVDIQHRVVEALKKHWPEYLMEAFGLGLFMVSAFTFGAALEHPASPIHRALPDPLLRRLFMGLAMGGTAIAIIYSPWGKRSGAHINPCVTLTFFRLDKIKKWDAALYILSQFTGGLIGAGIAAGALSTWVSHPAVNYVVTVPGESGVWAAFAAEVAIAFILMTVILRVSNNPRLRQLTGVCAGILVAAYITFEAPLSGMSMNPARSLASAAPAGHWTDLWIYFTGPMVGMLLGAEVCVGVKNGARVGCAKLHHENNQRCIFCGKPATKAKNNARHDQPTVGREAHRLAEAIVTESPAGQDQNTNRT